MAESRAKLQEEMKKHHEFLWNVFSQKPYKVRKILKEATNSELQILIKILYCVEEGQIPIKEKHYQILKNSRRLNAIVRLKEKVNSVLRLSVSRKRKWATQFTSLYKYLLYHLFENN